MSGVIRSSNIAERGIGDLCFRKGRVRGVWVQLLGGKGTCACVFRVLHECIWNAPEVSLVLPAFDDAGFLGFPPH